MNHVSKKKTKFVIVLMCLLLGFAQWTVAQNNVVKGKVTDASGEAILGANVTQKGSSNVGTITDDNGNFILSVPGNATLVVSYLGYTTKEVNVNNKTNLSIQLSENNQMLDEVVVVGYGTQKKATLTGSVSAVVNKEIAITKNENLVNMLAGKIPGVRVTQTSSRPGAFESQFDIRGLGAPLIVIDGVPSDNDTFMRLDANDIESVSVLKDASAAIYGLRSANGVILVTTKRGIASAGGYNIEYSTNFGWQQFLQVPDNVNALDYMSLVNYKNMHDFNGTWFSTKAPIFTQADMQPYIDGTQQTTDWMNAIFRKTAPQQQHNITVDGGNDKTKYFFNLGYMNQGSSLRSNSMNYNRWNFRSNVDVNLTSRLKASVSVGGYMDDMLEPAIDIWTVYKNAWTQLPNVPIYANNNPDYLNHGGATQYHVIHDGNPLGNVDSKYSGYNEYINRQFTGQLSLQYEIPGVKGLSAKAMYNYNFRDKDSKWFKKGFWDYTYDATTDTYTKGSIRNASSIGSNSIQRMDDKWGNTLMQLSLNYKRTFLNAHNLEVLGLYEESDGTRDNFFANRNLLLNSEYLFAGETTNQTGSMNKGDLWEETSKSFVGRLTYDYLSKYLFDFSFRYEGSSRFPINKRWGFFPVLSLGYRISEESFFKNSFLSFVNNLKLRASYGKTGDDSAASIYPPNVVGYNIDGNVGWIFNNAVTQGVSATGIPNPNLTWYTAIMGNYGFDIEMWKGLLGGSVEYFNRNRDGLIATMAGVVPKTVGATMPNANINSDRSFGWEFTISHKNKIGDVNYHIGGSLYSTRTQWRTKVETPASNHYDYWRNRLAGRYTNIWWGKQYLGQFQNYQQIYNYPVAIGPGTALPGDYYYQDWNGDGVIDGNDDHPIANYGLPLFNYGISLGANYRDFDLNMNFQGAAQIFYQYTEVLAEPLCFGDAGVMTKFLDRWHPADPTANQYDPNTQWISGYYSATGSPLEDGTRSIQNASYLRLKTIELGYTIPKNLLKRWGVKDLRIYLSGYNLLTFTGLRNMDPEHPGGSGGASTNGVDTYKYPLNKTYNIGASIKF